MNVSYLNLNRTVLSDADVKDALESSKAVGENVVMVDLYHGTKSDEFFILVNAYGENDQYVFAFVNVAKAISNNMLASSGPSLRLISSDFKIVYSNRENEIGKSFEETIQSNYKINAGDLTEALQSITGMLASRSEPAPPRGEQFKGYDILNGHNLAGVGEYFILIASPIEFQGYNGALVTVEPEEKYPACSVRQICS